MGRKKGTLQAYGRKKRKFHGKRIGDGRKKVSVDDGGGTSTGTNEIQSPTQERLELFKDREEETVTYDADAPEDMFMLVSVQFIDSLVSLISCPNCSKEHSSIDWKIKNRKGLAHNVIVDCRNCGEQLMQKYTSEQKEIKEKSGKRHLHHQINTRVVFAAQKNQLHCTKLNSFLRMTGLDGGLAEASYSKILKLIFDISKRNIATHLFEARKKVKSIFSSDEAASTVDVAVSFDGSWHKRGHTSKYGIGFCIEPKTRVVLDYMVVSKYCKMCCVMEKKMNEEDFLIWKSNHEHQCDKNYYGSSNAMETYIAEELWKRSSEIGFRYMTFIGDGDASVHLALKRLKPYGEEVEIKKNECILHVAKRMRKNLDNAVAEERARGHTMGGKGQLTPERRQKWGYYYRDAIVNAGGDAEKASRDTWAILYHNCSRHEYCGDWCFYKKGLLEGKREDEIVWPKSKNEQPLTDKMFEVLKLKIEKLADIEFLQKCMDLDTQNPNESLHSTIWNKCSKAKFIGKNYLESVVADSVIEWNSGAVGLMTLSSNAAIPMSPRVIADAASKDKRRIKNAENQPLTAASKRRRRQDEAAKNKRLEKEEGITYSAGSF